MASIVAAKKWSPTTKYEPSQWEIERAAARREQAKAGTATQIVRDTAGVLCPRCGRPTETRKHGVITEKMLRQAFHYARWLYCCNPMCTTTTIMRDENRVFRDDVDADTKARLADIAKQLRPRR